MDFLIMEAVALKAGIEERNQQKEAEKQREREAWKKDRSRLEHLR